MVAKTSKRTQIAMPKSMWVYLDKLAQEQKTTKSKIIEGLVAQMIQEKEKGPSSC